ncbi:unnamed protein product [Cylicocyclus nassatus]|uniref:F-box domain-containing protein n=1 Tax=Cylicocyclus nassatus TaxID=53992 RepID=A0AA36GID5_CYLNA|nr:unnamed protein product [Cylicocyclus nassatus]
MSGAEALEFRYWNELPDHLKMNVLHYLPFPTLRHFMFLNRKSYSLASVVKSKVLVVRLVDSPYVRETSSEESIIKLLIIWSRSSTKKGLNQDNAYCMSFVDDGKGGCFLKRLRDKETSISANTVHYNTDPESAALNVFFRLTESLKCEKICVLLRDMKPSTGRLLSSKPSTTLLICDSFKLVTEDPRLASVFVRYLIPGCSLEFHSSLLCGQVKTSTDTAFFNTNVVRFAPSLITEWKMAATDDHIVQLHAHTFSMKTPGVTSRGINQLLMEWFYGRRQISCVIFEEIQDADWKKILGKLKYYRELIVEELIDVVSEKRLLKKNPMFGFELRSSNNGVLWLIMTGNCCMLTDTSTQGF